ncbi:MAG: HDIG domain-containing protein [Clostridia bacterium]|nr:HDIG domain-containing protein [Clostridia bacterium]
MLKLKLIRKKAASEKPADKKPADNLPIQMPFPHIHMKAWRFIFFLLLSIVVWAILAVNLLPEQVSLNEGDIAAEDYFYEGATQSYVSDLRTEEARVQAAAAVEELYIIDEDVIANLANKIGNYFDAVTRAAQGELDWEQLREILPGQYSDAELHAVTGLTAQEIAMIKDSFVRMVTSVFELGVLEGDIEQARQNISLAIGTSAISGNAAEFLKSLNNGLDYSYNKVFDALATSLRIQQAQENVRPVQITVRQGEKLVSKGQAVSAEQIEALRELGLQSESRQFTSLSGLFLLVLLCFVLFYFYLQFYKKAVFERQSALLLLGVVTVVILLICKLISLISFSMDAEMTAQVGYLLPVAAAAMVITVLLDREVAVFATVLLAIFAGIAMEGSMVFILVALAGGLTGVLAAAHLNQRSQFVGASIYITIANLVVICAWGLIWHQSYQAIGLGMLFGLINGLLSAILAMGILPYLESAFGVTTVIRLLEYSNSNNLLLKRLMVEAPGTYNHSILVGNLAEAAADAIGADALLVRVSSYYHDIGKLRRPHFYIENQVTGDNPHDKLQPGLSARIIISHVADGVRMLREARFPGEIIDIVEQHHGNSLLSLFYNKAKEQALDPDEVKLADYCYKGPRPQTKEAALVMLADSVQAAVQAMDNRDAGLVEEKVHEIIQLRVREKQLDDCALTFHDLDVIVQNFLMVLSGIHHQRVSYAVPEALPEADIAEEKTGEGGKQDD